MTRLFTMAVATAGVVAVLTGVAEAGGLFMEMSNGLTGAGSAARAQDASALFKNPASMSHLQGSQGVSFGPSGLAK